MPLTTPAQPYPRVTSDSRVKPLPKPAKKTPVHKEHKELDVSHSITDPSEAKKVKKMQAKESKMALKSQANMQKMTKKEERQKKKEEEKEKQRKAEFEKAKTTEKPAAPWMDKKKAHKEHKNLSVQAMSQNDFSKKKKK